MTGFELSLDRRLVVLPFLLEHEVGSDSNRSINKNDNS